MKGTVRPAQTTGSHKALARSGLVQETPLTEEQFLVVDTTLPAQVGLWLGLVRAGGPTWGRLARPLPRKLPRITPAS